MATYTKILGANEAAMKLITAGQKCQSALAGALYVEAELIKTDSMKRTPVKTGALRASHIVSKPEVEGNKVSVMIGVGGPAAPYAIYVHEMTWLYHKVGEAKFLQHAVEAAISGLNARLAARMKGAI